MIILFAEKDAMILREALRDHLHRLENAPVLTSPKPGFEAVVEDVWRQARVIRKMLRRLKRAAGWTWDDDYAD